MKVIFFSSLKSSTGNKIQSIVEDRVPEQYIEIHRTIESVSKSFIHGRWNVTVAIFVIAAIQELFDLIVIQKTFENIRIILILPDRDIDTVSLGFKLFPKFIDYADNSLENVRAVLDQMIGLEGTDNLYKIGK